jgi:hypothetical protein
MARYVPITEAERMRRASELITETTNAYERFMLLSTDEALNASKRADMLIEARKCLELLGKLTGALPVAPTAEEYN